MPATTRRWSATTTLTVLGAVTGIGPIWLTRAQPQPPGSAVLGSGLRSPMPVIVIGPPLWAYLLAGIFGAVIGAGVALAASRVSRRRHDG